MTTKSPSTTPPRPIVQSGYQVEQTTELGQYVLKHRNGVLGLVVLLLLGIGGFGAYTYWKNQRQVEWDQQLYQYTSEVFEKYQAGEVEKAILMERVTQLQQQLENYEGVVAPLMLTADELMQKGELQDAQEVLAWIKNHFKSSEIQFYTGIRLAALLEDLGKIDQAIANLESIAQGQFKVFEGKVHLDLGRLYLKQNQKDKAKTHFQYVVDNSQESEFKKLAQLYLNQIGQ